MQDRRIEALRDWKGYELNTKKISKISSEIDSSSIVFVHILSNLQIKRNEMPEPKGVPEKHYFTK